MKMEELSNQSINDPTLLKRQENRTQEEYRVIPRSQQIRQLKGHQFDGNEENDYVVDPEAGWRFYKGWR